MVGCSREQTGEQASHYISSLKRGAERAQQLRTSSIHRARLHRQEAKPRIVPKITISGARSSASAILPKPFQSPSRHTD